MGYMLVFAFVMTAMLAGVRHVSAELLAFFRMLFGFLVFVPVLARKGLEPLRTDRFRLHALRGALHVTSVLLFFYGVSQTPLAKALAISFSAPLFATVLALLLLGEVVRLRRISALVIGFAGTVVILRPGLVEVETGALAILTAAAAWGSAMIVIKVLSRTEASLTTTLYSTILMTPVTLLVALPVWRTPDFEQLVWLGLIGGLGSLGHLALAQAMKEADVTAVLPFEFTKLIWAALFGFVLFAEIPDWGTWLGGTMIFTAVTYIAYRERQVRGDVGAVPGDPV
jgi:drug/metabolite transporter (DMT)-like permease